MTRSVVFNPLPIVTDEALALIVAKANRVEAIGERPQEERAFSKSIISKLRIAATAAVVFTALIPVTKVAKDSLDEYLSPYDTPVLPITETKVFPGSNSSKWHTAFNSYKNNSKDEFYGIEKTLRVDKKLSLTQSAAVVIAYSEISKDLFLGRDSKFLIEQREKEISDLSYFLENAWNNNFSAPPKIVKNPNVKYEHLQNPSWETFNRTWSCLKNDWMCNDSTSNINSNVLNTDRSLTKTEAHDILSDAVVEAGLAAVFIPAQIKDDPKRIYALAKNIQLANKDLQYITGWSGGVLGLNGRVILDFAPKGTSAVTRRDKSGFIYITSAWENMAHEWHHAMDWSMEMSARVPSRDLLSSDLSYQDGTPLKTKEEDEFGLSAKQAILWMKLNNPEISKSEREQILKEAVGQLKHMNNRKRYLSTNPMFIALYDNGIKSTADMPKNGSPWFKWRNDAAEKIINDDDGGEYLRSPTETLAFSFAASASALMRERHIKYNVGSVLDDVDFGRKFSPSYIPTKKEAEITSKYWLDFFAKSEQWWQNDSVKRGYSSHLVEDHHRNTNKIR